VAVLDYLADMTDRAVVRQLQASINYGNHEPNAILHKDIRGHHTLLLYKAPFGFNKGNNNLILYSFGSLPDMSQYFKRWRDNTNPFNKLLVKALTEITEILYFHRLHEEEDSTPSGYRS
jgi:hypothetical protein